MRQNAVDANLQAQQNQQIIQQMGQDVKKTPELARAPCARKWMRLNDQLKLADARSEERLRRLSQQVAEQEAVTKQAVRDLADRQAVAIRCPPPPDGRHPFLHPRRAAAPADPQSEARLRCRRPPGRRPVAEWRSRGRLESRAAIDAERTQSLGGVQHRRLGGQVQNQPSQARVMFEKALSLAPDEVKPSLQQALEEISRGGQ